MPAPAWLVATPIAHRGLHDERRPENSLIAIEAAVQRGFPIEIAVQVMGTLPLPDLRELSRDPDLPPATLAQARAELQRRGGIG